MALLLGFIGVLGFSFSLPATRLAVEDLDPAVVGLGRAVVAALLAAAWLALLREPLPTRDQRRRLALVALGVVVGFPLLTSIALRDLPAAHAAVIVGILPAATAVAAVVRAGERPSRGFWVAGIAGLAAALGFAAAQGAGAPQPADLLLLAAVALCALGYAEGAVLARDLGGPRTISWALVLSLPVTAAGTALAAATADGGLSGGPVAWLGFAYVALVSMFLAFFAWYAGLARGGVAKIGQVQLAQALLTLGWSALLLGEEVDALTLLAAVAVLACVVLTQRSRVDDVRHATAPARDGRDRLLASEP
jgi:drug/metabolite transporter (DMT)-like permease